MKISFLLLLSLVSSSLGEIYNKVAYFKMSLDLIIESDEYKEINTKNCNYVISDEVLNFQVFSKFFKNELNLSNEINNDFKEVKDINKDILKLNKFKKGSVKIFFSEIKNDIFFSEIFESNRKKIKYDERPIFGISYVYMFKIKNDKIEIVTVKKLNYN